MICKDRTYSRGGLLVYIRNEIINYKHRQDLEAPADQTTEMIWLELMLSNRSLLIAQVYRPPKLQLKFAPNWLDHIENSLQVAYTENKHIIVMGDVNINLWKSHPVDTKWLDICSNFGLVQIITEPT